MTLESPAPLEFIQPGKPAQRLRRKLQRSVARQVSECDWITSLSDAQRKPETWRRDYNQQSPHSSLDYVSPAQSLHEHERRRGDADMKKAN